MEEVIASSFRQRSRMASLAVPPVLLISALGGCGGDEAGTGSLSDLPEGTAVEELRIGSLDDPATALSVVTALSVADDGTIYIMQRQAGEVRVFSAKGEPLRTIGRRGEGPGEFQSPGALGIVGDSLWVFDFAGDRLSWFDRETGDLLVDFRAPAGQAGAGERVPRVSSLLEDGRFLASVLVEARSVALGETTEVPVFLMDREGTLTDTLPPQRYGNGTWEIEGRQGGVSRGGKYMTQPFADNELRGYLTAESAVVTLDRTAPTSPDRAVLGFTRTTFSGDTVAVRELPFDPRPITDAMADSVLEARIPNGLFGMTVDASREAGRESLYRPGWVPGATSLLAARDGRLWIRSNHVTEAGVVWWTVTSEGEPEHAVRLPAGFRGILARGDRIWGTEMDEFGVPYVVRYRVASE